jgi:hypothetical protein
LRSDSWARPADDPRIRNIASRKKTFFMIMPQSFSPRLATTIPKH